MFALKNIPLVIGKTGHRERVLRGLAEAAF